MKKLWEKYREIVLYLVFGVLTTLVGMGTYFVILAAAEKGFHIDSDAPVYNVVRVVAQVLQWVLAVLFAYVTNKRFVFRAEGGHEVKRLASFFTARLFSLGADSLVTFGVIAILGIAGYETFRFAVPLFPIVISFTPDFWGKTAAAIVVIILNYILSKFIVFRKGKNNG